MFEEIIDFWNSYDWDWKNSADVENFIDEALRTGVLEDSWGGFGVFNGNDGMDSEDWVNYWWCNVQESIEKISKTFSTEELNKSLAQLMRPMEAIQSGGDQAIYDALIKYIEGFPSSFPEYASTLAIYDEVWCEFSWLSMGDWRYCLWIFYGRDSIAKSPNVNPDFLKSMFEKSFHYEHRHQALRVRIGLAMNPATPAPVLKFLVENRNGADWLLHDSSFEDLEIVFLDDDGNYQINSDLDELEELREEASDLFAFNYKSSNSFEDCPGVEYMENLFGEQITFKDAGQALKAALAKNTSIESRILDELAAEENPFIQYFLSKNKSISELLKVRFALLEPTVTFQPYGSDIADKVTLD